MFIEVKNLNGTTDNTPPSQYSSWQEWWEKQMNRKFLYCSCMDCFNFAEVGAHVKKVNDGNEWYIVPLCKECNARTDNFYVSEYNLAKINSSN